MTRLEKIYREKVVPVLQKEFNYSSSMQLPGIEKISLNIGLGAASQNNKLMEEAVAELTASIRPGIIFTPRSPSLPSSCVKACPSGLASPCARIVCGTSWTS